MKKAILLSIVLVGTLFSVKPQSYPKAPGTIRLLTYNTHYCKGGYDPGEINESNVKKLAQVIKALDADVIALQELDSASQSRGNRYLLHEIAEHTGIEYTDVYANAARFDKKGSIGCGALVRKNLPIVSRYIAYLPGDEPRAAIQLELEKFVFIATHSDLNNEKRRQGTKIICNDSREMKNPYSWPETSTILSAGRETAHLSLYTKKILSLQATRSATRSPEGPTTAH